jgi:hypothetical protein
MRLLFDQSFPAHIEQYSEHDFSFVRWSADQVSDVELLESAAAEGMRGVVFLGLQALADGTLVRDAKRLGLFVAATHDTEPMQAARAISTHLPALRRAVRPGVACHVFAAELRILKS